MRLYVRTSIAGCFDQSHKKRRQLLKAPIVRTSLAVQYKQFQKNNERYIRSRLDVTHLLLIVLHYCPPWEANVHWRFYSSAFSNHSNSVLN